MTVATGSVTGALRGGERFTASYPPGFAADQTARPLAAHVDVGATSGGKADVSLRVRTIVAVVLSFVVVLVFMLVATARRGGAPRVISATPNVALPMGYDIEAALEAAQSGRR